MSSREFVVTATEAEAKDYQEYLREIPRGRYGCATPETDPFLVALGKFDKAGRELLREWDDVASDGNHPVLLVDSYPFGDRNFDDVASAIWSWTEAARRRAKLLFETAVEPVDPNGCAECARSNGPNYSGPCGHEGGFARLSLLIVLTLTMMFGAVFATAQSRSRKLDNANASVNAPVKEAHYCGAMTKKGAPCRNRVKAAGSLCWIHARAATAGR